MLRWYAEQRFNYLAQWVFYVVALFSIAMGGIVGFHGKVFVISVVAYFGLLLIWVRLRNYYDID